MKTKIMRKMRGREMKRKSERGDKGKGKGVREGKLWLKMMGNG